MKKIFIIAMMSFVFGAVGGYVKSYMNVREYRTALIAHAKGGATSKYILDIIGVKKTPKSVKQFAK